MSTFSSGNGDVGILYTQMHFFTFSISPKEAGNSFLTIGKFIRSYIPTQNGLKQHDILFNNHKSRINKQLSFINNPPANSGTTVA